MNIIVHQMFQFFLLISLGCILYKAKVINQAFNASLSRLLLNCGLPATILSSVLASDTQRDMHLILEAFLVSIALYLFLPLFSFLLVKLMRIPEGEQGVYMMMTTFGNVGFMGIPVVDALFGTEYVFYAAILNIIFNITSFTVGILQVNYRAGNGTTGSFQWKSLLSPGITLSVFSIIVYIYNLHFPQDIEHVIDMLGGLTTPLAMILVGSTLATMPVRDLFREKRTYLFLVIRLLVLPLILWAGMKLLVPDTLVLNIYTVLMLMPIANNTVMFATLYGRDEKLAARTVFLSTFMSMITVPLMVAVLL